MSITDGLREFAPNLDLGKVALAGWKEALLAIADHIDAEHQKAIRELNNLADSSMLLPVDADGVPIHVGDKVMDWDTPRVVAAVSEDSICLAGYESNSYYRMGIAKNYHHYHEPTVEDLLLDACRAYHSLMVESMSDVAHDMPAPSEIIDKYASKLRLANNGEE